VSGGKKLDSVPISDLNESILNLNNSINLLLELFEEASEKLKSEKEEIQSGDISTLGSKLDIMIDQNKAIAKGILYLVKSDQQEKEELKREREEQKQLREKLLDVQKSISSQSFNSSQEPQKPQNISPMRYSAQASQPQPTIVQNQFLDELNQLHDSNNINLENLEPSPNQMNAQTNNTNDQLVLKKGFFKR